MAASHPNFRCPPDGLQYDNMFLACSCHSLSLSFVSSPKKLDNVGMRLKLHYSLPEFVFILHYIVCTFTCVCVCVCVCVYCACVRVYVCVCLLILQIFSCTSIVSTIVSKRYVNSNNFYPFAIITKEACYCNQLTDSRRIFIPMLFFKILILQ